METQEIEIRALGYNELELIRPLLERFFREAKYPGKFSWASFDGAWTPVIFGGVGFVNIAQDESGRVVAMIGAMHATDPYNGEKTSLVNFWYVLPEMRHLGIGAQIFKDMELQSKEDGCTRMLAGHPGGLEGFFDNAGYSPVETNFSKQI